MCEYCKVLIIDDEFIMRQGMKHMLEWEKEGFLIVGEASNGQEGIRLVEELAPHIVLADIVMPVIDGIEFSEILGKKYPSIQLIMLSSYDKFEYVKTTLMNGATDYILKPTLNPEILRKTLLFAAKRIPGLQLGTKDEVPWSSQLERMLLGYSEKLDEAVFAEIFPHSLYRMLCIDLKETCGSRRDSITLAGQELREYFEEKRDFKVLTVLLEESIFCAIFNYRVKQEQVVMEDVKLITKRQSHLYQRAFLVLSRSFSDRGELRKVYQNEVKPQLRQAFYYYGQPLFQAEKPVEAGTVKRFEFEDYSRYLTQNRQDEALLMLENYTAYLWEQQVEEERLKNLTKNLLYHFLMEIEKYDIPNEELKDKYFAQLDGALWLEEFQEELRLMIDELRQILIQKSGIEDSRIHEIKQFVDSHYMESLELSDIATRCNLNYNYLSSYFSQTTREGFNEYLNKIRIAHASRLLREQELPISTISVSVGYSDHSYFCRVFKKITGETPSDYRRRMRHG